MPDPFRSVAIIGTGLIGTSLALALKSQRNPARVTGFDLNGDSRRGANGAKTATGQKAFDKVVGNFREAVRGAELVCVATPVQGLEVAFQELAATVGPGTIVTDTAGTKEKALAWASELLPESVEFVGGDPMVFKVAAGPWEAEATLFQNAMYCLCPLPRTNHQAVERVVKLVEGLGAIPYFVDANEHDGLVAGVNDLPYLVSAAVMNSVASGRGWREAAALATSAFATASHLSEGDPEMIADLCLSNRDEILRQLDRFGVEVASLRDEIARGDRGIKQRFERAQRGHREWLSGRAAEGGATREPIETESLKPQSLFLGSRLGGLLRGKSRERE